MLELLPMRYWLGVGERRQSWVDTRGLKVKGLVSAKTRGGRSVWEIDQLVLPPDFAQEEMDLLHGLALGAARSGVDRVFLRLAADCAYLDAVRSAGFCFYMTEYLYRLDKGGKDRKVDVSQSGNHLNPMSPANEFGIFQLYNSAYPLHVRGAEGQTFEEWREAREHSCRGRNGKEYIFLEGGSVSGWVSATHRGKQGCFGLMLRPGGSMEMERLLNAAEALLSRQSTLWCMTSEFQAPLAGELERRGYQLVEEYATAVRYVTAKVRRPSLVPIGVK